MCPMHKSGRFLQFHSPKKASFKPWQYLPIHPLETNEEGLSILSLMHCSPVFLVVAIPSLYTEETA